MAQEIAASDLAGVGERLLVRWGVEPRGEASQGLGPACVWGAVSPALGAQDSLRTGRIKGLE